MSKYTLEKFNSDMKQLGGMIESFYSQKGGQSNSVNNSKSKRGEKSGNPDYNDLFYGGKPSLDASSYDVGYKMKESDGKVWTVKKIKGQKKWIYERRYKVLSVNGRPYGFYSSYSGTEPKDAARKAFRWISKKILQNDFKNKNKLYNFKATFQLKEITRGSDKRSYGPYYGHYKKLKTPKTFQFPGMNKSQTQTHDIYIRLAKK